MSVNILVFPVGQSIPSDPISPGTDHPELDTLEALSSNSSPNMLTLLSSVWGIRWKCLLLTGKKTKNLGNPQLTFCHNAGLEETTAHGFSPSHKQGQQPLPRKLHEEGLGFREI